MQLDIEWVVLECSMDGGSEMDSHGTRAHIKEIM